MVDFFETYMQTEHLCFLFACMFTLGGVFIMALMLMQRLEI